MLPAIQNMAWEKDFLWDGGVHQLDLFPMAPLENPVEMDEKLSNVLQKLRDSKNPNYPELFKKAFGTTEINTERFTKALSQFMLFLVSNNSRYDLYSERDDQCHHGNGKRRVGAVQTKMRELSRRRTFFGPFIQKQRLRHDALHRPRAFQELLKILWIKINLKSQACATWVTLLPTCTMAASLRWSKCLTTTPKM
jgi:hypothetical protein